MKLSATYGKLIFTAFLVLGLSFCFAATTGKGTTGGDNNTISLKNITKYPRNKSISTLSLSQFQYKGSQDLFQQNVNNYLQVQSMIRFQKGNTTYVFPYNYKVVLPAFKTPTPSATTH